MHATLCRLLCLLALLPIVKNAYSQGGAAKPALPGARYVEQRTTMPDVALTGIINWPESSLRVSDLKHKVLILDFWATWCGPCVESLDWMDSLVQQYDGRLYVLAVTRENSKTVKSFLDKRSKKWRFPIITSDTLLSNLFPHRTVPHEVIIDSSFNVITQTTPEEITATKMSALMNDRNAVFRTKQVLLYDDKDVPLFDNAINHRIQPFISHSILTPYIDGLSGFASLTSENGNISKFTVVNQNPFQMFYMAYTKYKLPLLNFRRIVIESGELDSARVFSQKTEDLYTYEYVLPKKMPDSVVFRDVMADLNRYFEFGGRVEVRNVPCLVWIDGRSSVAKHASAGKSGHSVSSLITGMNMAPNALPVINESHLKKTDMVNVQLQFNEHGQIDTGQMEAQLKAYGVNILLAERPVPVLVLYKK